MKAKMTSQGVNLAALGGKAPKQSEEEFQRAVIAYAKLHGWRVAHFRAVRVQRKNGSVYYETPVAGDGAGFPDLILLRDGDIVVAELKSHRGVVRPNQLPWLDAWHRVGAYVYLWRPDSWAEIEAVLGGEE